VSLLDFLFQLANDLTLFLFIIVIFLYLLLHQIFIISLALFVVLGLITKTHENWESFEKELTKLNLTPLSDSRFESYLNHRLNRTTEAFSETRSNSSSVSKSSMSSNVSSVKLPTVDNTKAKLSQVDNLKLVKCAFDEAALVALLVKKLFGGDDKKLEGHVSLHVGMLQQLRAFLVLLREDEASDGLVIGEVKIQKKFVLPFLKSLVRGKGMHFAVDVTTHKLSAVLSIKSIRKTVGGLADFIFHSTGQNDDAFLTELTDNLVRALLEFKPPYGAMKAHSWDAWDQTVFEALELRQMRGGLCAKVGVMDLIASGVVIADSLATDDLTLGTVRIYSRCVKARQVVLHMLLLLCDLSMDELDSITMDNGGELIFTEEDGAAPADNTDAVVAGATTSTSAGAQGMVTRSSKGGEKSTSVASTSCDDKTGLCRPMVPIDDHACVCGPVVDPVSTLPPQPVRAVLAPLTTANLNMHNMRMDCEF
jgi:hypothetical protein